MQARRLRTILVPKAMNNTFFCDEVLQVEGLEVGYVFRLTCCELPCGYIGHTLGRDNKVFIEAGVGMRAQQPTRLCRTIAYKCHYTLLQPFIEWRVNFEF